MKIYVLISFTAMLISGCSPSAPEAKYKKQNDSLITVINENETSVKNLITVINDVETNLDSITRKQNIIIVNFNKTSDLKFDKTSRINEEIKAINNMMEQNIKKIIELNRKLKNSNKKNEILAQTIQTLKNKLDRKYFELDQLNGKLNSLNLHVNQLQYFIDSLSLKNFSNLQTIMDDAKALHKAYYIVGEKSDLEKSKIIDSQGGLLGIGKTAKLNDNIDNGYFTQIDYLQTTNIAISSKKIKIITTHPPDSYTLEKDGKLISMLMIIDPEKFWSASKYLVVVVE